MDSFFNNSGHDEMTQVFLFNPSVDLPPSPSALFNIHDNINSNIDCDLPDNEDAVDIIKYLDSPDYVRSNVLTSKLTLTQVCYDKTIPLSQSERDDDWMPNLKRKTEDPVFNDWMPNLKRETEDPVFNDWMPNLKRETEDPVFNDWMPNLKRETEEPVFNGWITKSEAEEDEFMTGFNFSLYSPSKFLNISDQGIEINIATGNDNDVDTESVETATDASCSTDMFDATVPSNSTASISSSTNANNKGVCTARWISTPRPQGRRRGRPPGSKKKQQSARTGQAITSKSASLPSCSKPETENSTASNPVGLGRKQRLVKDDKTQSQPTYTQGPSTNITANFHDYALNPASPSTTETGRPTVVSKRNYRRNTVDAVDKEKQNHHNKLERNRRQQLADLFTGLRDEVPKISCNPKASKVFILNEARFHILNLENTNKLQEEEASRLSQNKKLLKIQLQQLQSKISGRVK